MAYDPQQLASKFRSELSPQDITSLVSDPSLFPQGSNPNAQGLLAFLGSNMAGAQGDPMNFIRRLLALRQGNTMPQQAQNLPPRQIDPIGQLDPAVQIMQNNPGRQVIDLNKIGPQGWSGAGAANSNQIISYPANLFFNPNGAPPTLARKLPLAKVAAKGA